MKPRKWNTTGIKLRSTIIRGGRCYWKGLESKVINHHVDNSVDVLLLGDFVNVKRTEYLITSRERIKNVR